MRNDCTCRQIFHRRSRWQHPIGYTLRITDTTTTIYFGNDDAVKVKETPAEILMLRAL
jgi:hypothetical protein